MPQNRIRSLLHTFSAWIMAIVFVAAGINHFVHPGMYVAIMPRLLPTSLFPTLVAISGGCEVVFGLLVLPPFTRRIGAWLIIALLVAVFPANVQMAIDFARRHDPDAWLAWLRLPLQAVLVWWAYSVGKRSVRQNSDLGNA